MDRAAGIDLGTTNSVAALVELGTPSVVPTVEGGRLTPSVVAFTRLGEVLVGDAARRQFVANPARTFRSIKRKMGSDWRSDAIDDRCYSPQEIAAHILRKVRDDAVTHLRQPVSKVVVTVPAYFDEVQRSATKEACEIAGLDVLRLINEPTAAALAYGLDRITSPETILVFDLGGGTFDVSVLIASSGHFEVLATSGDTALGGDDWDERIVRLLVDRFEAKTGQPVGDDLVVAQRLREAAETAKIELSALDRADVSIPFLVAGPQGPIHLQESISRAELEAATADLLERCLGPFGDALTAAGLTPSDLDRVLLVGGSTRMPAVQRLVRRLTGQEPASGVNPEEAVALGAAVQAAMLNRELEGIELLDVTPLSLGLEVRGGVVARLIDRNTTIPTRCMKIFTTAEDGQTDVDLHIIQGEREIASANRSLGRFHLEGIPAAPRRIPQIEVTFDVDADGILTVTAKDRATGSKQRVSITGRPALSPDEVRRMIREAEAHADEDRAIRAEVEMRQQVEAVLRRARDLLDGGANAVTTREWQRIQEQVRALQAAYDAGDRDGLRAAYREFTTALSGYELATSLNYWD
jgi:molecular chaperone DnaK